MKNQILNRPQKATFLTLLSSLLFGSLAFGKPAIDEEFLAQLNIRKKIIYKTVAGKKLDLWLFLPKEQPQEPMPIMIHTHGGGWGGGSKHNIIKSPFRGTLTQLLEEGVACASIEYRLCGKTESNAIQCVEDCKDAARFLVAHAKEYHLDPDRMGVWGGSAGGHLSLMTGLTENSQFKGDEKLANFEPHFRCIASYFPATTFTRPDLLKGSKFESPERMTPIIGGLVKDFPEQAALLSPTEYLQADSPPILLLHGKKDTVLPFVLSEHFMELAEEKGADVELLAVKGAAHSFGGKKISPSIEEINQHATTFILKHLRSSK